MTTIYRFFAEKRPGFDIEAQGLLSTLQGYLHIEGLQGLRIFNRYDIEGLDEKDCDVAGRLILSEPQCDTLYLELLPEIAEAHTIFAVEAYRDNMISGQILLLSVHRLLPKNGLWFAQQKYMRFWVKSVKLIYRK